MSIYILLFKNILTLFCYFIKRGGGGYKAGFTKPCLSGSTPDASTSKRNKFLIKSYYYFKLTKRFFLL